MSSMFSFENPSVTMPIWTSVPNRVPYRVPNLPSQFVDHIQRFQPNEKGVKNLTFCDVILEEDYERFDYPIDTIFWGNDLKVVNYYGDEILKYFPIDENDDISSHAEQLQTAFNNVYYYSEEGIPQENFPQIHEVPVSERSIDGNFSDVNVQQKTLEVLKMCGKDVTRLDLPELFKTFHMEVLKFLPDLKTLCLDEFDDSQDTYDFLKHVKTFYPRVNVTYYYQ